MANLFNSNLDKILLVALAIGTVLIAYFLIKKGSRVGKFYTPTLDRFSRDLTREAIQGKIDTLIGRDEEIKRVVQILSRRRKNNVIFLGDAGTGKTALAEGLAAEIASGQMPSALKSKRVLALNLGGMLAGTQYRGEFEGRMKAITDEISAANHSIILFIDEIQNLTQAGESAGAIGAANLLKPALARGDIQAIGACTIKDYFKYIINDSSLARRFQPVIIKESTPEETEKILLGIKSYYEKHHNVLIPEEIIKTIIELCDRHLTDRYFPDKAIDAMDEAASKANMDAIGQNSGQIPTVSVNDAESVISQWRGNLEELKKRGNY